MTTTTTNKYKMIPVDTFWKQFAKGKHQDLCKTLVLVEDPDGLREDFAYVMPKYKSFDHPREGFIHYPIRFVLVKY